MKKVQLILIVLIALACAYPILLPAQISTPTPSPSTPVLDDDKVITQTSSQPDELYFWIKEQGVDANSGFLVEEYYSLKWQQMPNMTDGFDVVSTWSTGTNIVVADDWLCNDPRPIARVRWWGSYLGWMADTDASVPPPLSPDHFRISWHAYTHPDGLWSYPSDLIMEEQCYSFFETWYGAVPDWQTGTGPPWEHEYLYDQILTTSWAQETGYYYFINIQAVFSDASYSYHHWGWKNCELTWNDDAVWSSDGIAWNRLTWPTGHRLTGSMDMSFELYVEITPTPTPTPTPYEYKTPTPTPTPTPLYSLKWQQLPNMTDGFDVVSTWSLSTNMVVADDWLCNDPRPISRVRWWGSYPGWMEDTDASVPPPLSPDYFLIGWFNYTHPASFWSYPAGLLAVEQCYSFSESWYGAVPDWQTGTGPPWEHEYLYDQYLTDSWEQETGYYYFIGILAVFSTNPDPYYWGWKNCETTWNDDAVWSSDVITWNPLVWPTGHRLEGQSMDMSFELYVKITPTPTPCNAWVRLTDVMEITLGWIEYTTASALGIGLVNSGPGNPAYPAEWYGWIYDAQDIYNDGSEFYDHPRLWLSNDAGYPITIPEGYYFDVSHDSPDATSPLRIWMAQTTVPDAWEWLPSIGTDGTVYTDTSNCTVWKAPVTPIPTPTPVGYKTPIPTPTPEGGGGRKWTTPVTEPTEPPPTTPPAAPEPTAPPTGELLLADPGDYDGDGIADVAIFRPGSGLWVIRGLSRFYFGESDDLPVSGDYDGDGSSDGAVFRSGLWAIKGLSRAYLGTGSDVPVPGDYDGDGRADVAIFRTATGLWAVKGLTKLYFGGASDVAVPGDYDGDGAADIGIFRSSAGLWKIKDITLFYLGAEGDIAVPGDYDGSGLWTAGVFRPASGLWAIRGITRLYFGEEGDQLLPGDYDGDLTDDIAIFRPKAGLWAVEGVTRIYLGTDK